MSSRWVWVMTAAVVGIIWYDLTHTLRARHRRADINKELGRWEGEGGNVAAIKTE